MSISLQRNNTKPATAAAGAPPAQAGGPAMYGQPQQPLQSQYGYQGQPGMQQPMGQPGMQQPGMQQPMGQPGMQQPGMMSQPGMQQPMGMQQPGMQQPGMMSQPGMQQPGMMSQPGMQQPGMMSQPGMQQPGMMSQPGMQQPMGMQPGMQQPGMMSQPGMQQPMGMQQPIMGNPAMGGAPGGISLVKGQNMSLSKVAPNLIRARIGLGWDVRQGGGAAFDLDCSVFCVDGNGRVPRPQEFIFYNNLQNSNGSIRHLGDNLTGQGEGDDEMLNIDLTQVPQDIQRVVFIVSIYDADNRRQNFGMVQRAFIRILNADSNQEIVRYDLTEEACMLSTMMFGELYRYGAEWKFKALGNPVQGGLRACGQQFGLPLA